jgi:hypothetical protein
MHYWLSKLHERVVFEISSWNQNHEIAIIGGKHAAVLPKKGLPFTFQQRTAT